MFSHYMGSTEKRMRLEEEIECTERRKSSRIVALEEKKQQERERKLAQALERKNNDVRNKGKGKATMEVCDDDMSDSNNNEDEEGPTKKSCKSKELYQLISSIKSIQELGRQSQDASASGTNVSSLNGMALKQIFEMIIDFLQRKDSLELFAEPVNPSVVEHYYEIVKQPMDFGTMRAKLHEGMYTDLEQCKRDVFLICSNALNASLENSKYHQVAKDISRHAKWIFEALSADPEHFELESSLNKRRSDRKPQSRQRRTSRRVSSKPAGINKSSSVTVPETEKRDMYWPPSKPLASKVLYTNKHIIQLNKNPIKYKESLLRFVEDLGPIAQRVATKKLEAFKDQQLCNDENVSSTQIIHQPTPQTPTQDDTFDAQTLALALPFLNRPLTIPGSAAQEKRIVNTTNAGSVNIRDGSYQGNRISTNDSWHARAAALFSNFFFNNDKSGSSSGIESSNARGTMNFLDLSKDKKISPLQNVSSPFAPVHEHDHKLQLGVNKTSNTSQWNTSARIPNMLATGSSSNVFARVYPTRVISGPQPRPLNSGNRNRLSGLSHSRPENFMSCMPRNNLPESLVHQPRPEDFVNLSNLTPAPRSRPENFMSCMPSNNLTKSLVHQPRPEDFVNLSDLTLAPQSRIEHLTSYMPNNNLRESLANLPRPEDTKVDMTSNYLREQSLMYNQHHHQPWPAESMSSLNPLRLFPLPQPMQEVPVPNFKNSSCLTQRSQELTHQQAAPYNPPVTQGFPDMQMQEVKGRLKGVLDLNRQ
ncbi:uncharacterized protein LOC109812493 isoform X2 [Cajanus cajan]|uniref:uncharacterized protein LOC109812493 isoform X2 n=1 Tax=Cajanus cajan TaxID=3821 RepID=UPI00098D76E9|nr:uncharacterized protein LOC109812493 isoform X2 [Cajanus cajan]